MSIQELDSNHVYTQLFLKRYTQLYIYSHPPAPGLPDPPIHHNSLSLIMAVNNNNDYTQTVTSVASDEEVTVRSNDQPGLQMEEEPLSHRQLVFQKVRYS